MQPEITLAIPVYNSAEKLKVTLLSLSEFLGDERVEVLVSDNDSSDHTECLISEFSRSQYNLNYIKLSQNVGYGGNVKNCLERSLGAWVWLISSGDRLVLEDSVDSFLNRLRSIQGPSALVQSKVVSTEGSGILDGRIGLYDPKLSGNVFRGNLVRDPGLLSKIEFDDWCHVRVALKLIGRELKAPDFLPLVSFEIKRSERAWWNANNLIFFRVCLELDKIQRNSAGLFEKLGRQLPSTKTRWLVIGRAYFYARSCSRKTDPEEWIKLRRVLPPFGYYTIRVITLIIPYVLAAIIYSIGRRVARV